MGNVKTKTSDTVKDALRLALPSDGEMHEPCLNFLRSCGIPVQRLGSRRYTASLTEIPEALVLFQRSADIAIKVDEGSADLGIVGLDRVKEYRPDDSNIAIVLDDLGFGRCELVLAVPELWIDVTSTKDLADLSVEFMEKGRELRIATKYPLLVARFLYTRGINYFTLVSSSGTLEAAPTMGYADLIADLTATGTTLRENGLKTLDDGSILKSQACLIAAKSTLNQSKSRLDNSETVIERLEGHIRGRDVCAITATLFAQDPEILKRSILESAVLSNVQSPTFTPLFSAGSQWNYSATILVKKNLISEALRHLRSLGSDNIAVSPLAYLYSDASPAFTQLKKSLQGADCA